MKRSSTLFLQFVLVVVGMGVMAFLLWEPQLEGRNANASNFAIYFQDPFLVYVYFASIAFFVALYQAFKLLGYLGRNELFSPPSVNALRTIKRCAMTLVVFLLGAEVYFLIALRGKEDIAGGVMMGVFLILVSVVVGSAATVLESSLQSAVEMKCENDLTV